MLASVGDLEMAGRRVEAALWRSHIERLLEHKWEGYTLLLGQHSATNRSWRVRLKAARGT